MPVLLLAIGLVLVVEGLVFALAPSRLEDLLAVLKTLPLDARRALGLGAVALLGAHMGSGVLNAQTWPFSALLLAPVMLGVWLGGMVMDRVDPVLFRKMTLLVLMVAGLNLIRRALF